MSIRDEWVSDVRTARAGVTGEPELRTPGGRSPIDPMWIRVTYNIATGEVYGVEVGGLRLDDKPEPGRFWHRSLTRRIKDVHTAPEWVHEFIEKHRPPSPGVRR